ncbi:sirohydrochlorin chelatase [Thalassorhabdus alkalitolerans]|uniref:Sirohydrochlorin chelatase n=1 Tax=Thalassorhabdus alkalitolerans TaxID=2282697 RepID=A0ABW0YRZ7_9BACI
MKAVLFIGHGSKKKEGNEGIIQFVDNLKQKVPAPIVETCFLEFASPGLASGIETCVKRGATEVALVPIMFFPAGHSKIHIPQAIDKARKLYPLIRFHYGRPIGIHEEMFQLLKEKLDAGVEKETLYNKDTSILLVGRGSSDVDANSELFKLSRILSEKLEMAAVEVSFIGVTTPTVEEGVERCIRLGASNILMVPYFFFAGILMDRMDAKLKAFKEKYTEQEFYMTDPIGLHKRLEKVLLDRAEEAVGGNAKLNCDMCQYRLFALEHMDIHHDHDHSHHHDHDHEHSH